MKLSINDSGNSNNPLLKSLQNRIFTLGKQTDTTNEQRQQFFSLVAAIEQSQTESNGCVSVDYFCKQLAIDIDDLQHALPQLIGLAEQTHTPIVTFNGNVAFRRRYNEMMEIVDYLRNRNEISPISEKALTTINWEAGQDNKGNSYTLSNEQRLAALTAASLPFSLITGGAGTGKTTTLTKGLELLLLDNPNAAILLAAPTGKAAQRLNESMQKQLPSVHETIRPQLANLQAKTLHRLLKINEKTGKAQYHAHNPLFCDVLAVDESSMLGGALFRQLIGALLPNTRLILLGDANQLPAIDNFAFFNEVSRLPLGYTKDFCQLVSYAQVTLAEQPSPLPNHLCRLTTARRFAEESTVDKCANATLANDADLFIDNLGDNFYPLSTMKKLCEQLAVDYVSSKDLLIALSKRVVLCAKRKGYYGSEAINEFLDDFFRKRLGEGGLWYNGRRILIEKNDYQLDLSNGDIGVCHQSDNQWVIAFDGGRELPVADLPQQYSLAFAISIHKSQGSEYRHVDIVLDAFDDEHANSLVTQSLIYTAITRAKESITVYGDKKLIEVALGQVAEINSPLAAILCRDNHSLIN